MNPFERFNFTAPKLNKFIESGPTKQIEKEEREEKNKVNLPEKRKKTDNTRNTPGKNHIETLEKLITFRERVVAPIDKYGTHKVIDFKSSLKDQRFQALIASILSSQTKDEVTAGAMKRLHNLEGSLNIKKIQRMNEKQLDELLNPVGFHGRKAKYIKQCADILEKDYNGDVPKRLDQLTKLPGVGPKIARLILLVAWNQEDGIIVDTHVHRIANRLRWTSSNKDPESTRKELEQWIPQCHWGKISKVMIGFGQKICLSVNPKCTMCPLATSCPSAHLVGNNKKHKT